MKIVITLKDRNRVTGWINYYSTEICQIAPQLEGGQWGRYIWNTTEYPGILGKIGHFLQ